MRQATVLVADDMSYSVNGKLTLVGVYAGDIHIPTPHYRALQLVFFFAIDSDHDDQFERIDLSVTLPSGDKRTMEVPLKSFRPTVSDQVRWNYKPTLLFQNANLTVGHMDVKVIHEKGEIPVSAPSIALHPQYAAAPSNIMATASHG